ncbi:hypothetical protein DKX38_009036 [Salix brachista]|uniref:Uncharacterized protein n=1 Tax=Salix brachista TaxID=2182728 RepID=A0A5N5M9H1_9ROSI|nr:hypothetical protein DKX38_009036 [Salix brachista]
MAPEQHNISVEPEVNSKICRVPGVFRRNPSPNEDCYSPLVVSIGLYHKDDPNHELAEMQTVKNEMLEQFASRSGKTREVLYSTVAKLTSSARRCYDEGSTEDLDDSAFTEMMLLDGCFILQFIFCFLREPQNLKLNNRVLAYFVKRDLFLLENQLPYEVLTSLMSLEFDHEEEGKKLMEEFMDGVHVKELRKSGILLNVLGSDQEVADLFNDISRFMVFNPNAYGDVQSSIEKHCKNVTKKWVAEWLHNHFSSPWTFLAFAGAVVALVLSFIQTYTALYPGNK